MMTDAMAQFISNLSSQLLKKAKALRTIRSIASQALPEPESTAALKECPRSGKGCGWVGEK